MKYFLFNPASQAVTGPFELHDIEAKLQAGEFPAETLAIAEVGESLAQGSRTTAEDWRPVQSIPGFGQERPSNLPPPIPASAPPRSAPVQIHFCPFCRHLASGPVVLGESRCERCGKLLYPEAGTVERRPHAPSRPVSTLEFAAGVIGGLVAQFVSFVMVCGFAVAFFGFRKSGNQAAVFFAVFLCLGWVAWAIPTTRTPANRGFAFGVLLGVGLTALLTANCALR